MALSSSLLHGWRVWVIHFQNIPIRSRIGFYLRHIFRIAPHLGERLIRKRAPLKICVSQMHLNSENHFIEYLSPERGIWVIPFLATLSGATMAHISDRFLELRTILEEAYLIIRFPHKLCSHVNTSKFENMDLQSSPLPGSFVCLLPRRNRPTRRRLGAHLRQIFRCAPFLAKAYSICGLPQRICDNANSSKFGKMALSSSLSPDWCVLIIPCRHIPIRIRLGSYRRQLFIASPHSGA